MVIGLEFQAIGIPECRVTQSKTRVLFYCRIERSNGQVEIAGLVVALHISQGFEVSLIDAWRYAAGRRGDGLGRIDFHQAGETSDGLILKSGEVATVVLELYRTDLPEALRVNQNHGQPQILAFALNRSLHDHGGAEIVKS